MEIDENQESEHNFISCLCVVKRGVAKEVQEQVALTTEEIKQIIAETQQNINNDDDDEDDEDTSMENVNNTSNPNNDEYNFATYDDEGDTQVASIADIAVIDNDDEHNINDDGEDSEVEDDKITPNDNLILVGHIEDDSACLEVYVYNEDEGSLYVHHDFILPTHPLCIEWMNYDPETKDEGNMCAIGGMDPIITVWDLDIHNSIEPIARLGHKGSRKKKIQKYGHSDAVLDLSWNKNFVHVLASGSVDQTVILWDLENKKPHTIIDDEFEDKVQSLKFHNREAETLLTGCCDGTVTLFDCRSPGENLKRWKLSGEIERVTWDLINDNYFFAANNKGKIWYLDRRQEEKIWSKKIHKNEISGITTNINCPGMLTTTSADETLKIWKFDENGITAVHDEELRIGRTQCLDYCPDNPFVVMIGGDFKKKNFKVVDIKNFDTVRHTFLQN